MSKYNVCFTVGNKKVIVENIKADCPNDAIIEARSDSRLFNKQSMRFNWYKEV